MVAAADRGCCEYDFNNGDGERDLACNLQKTDLGCARDCAAGAGMRVLRPAHVDLNCALGTRSRLPGLSAALQREARRAGHRQPTRLTRSRQTRLHGGLGWWNQHVSPETGAS
jgi:hypothetical protein